MADGTGLDEGTGHGSVTRPATGVDDETCVWILGLIHSGTTIFWQAWRSDGRFLCFEEPFLPLATLPEDNRKGTHTELAALFRAEPDPRRFWNLHAPLHPLQELDKEFTAEQEVRLRHLVSRSRRVVIDETHLHLHLPALASLTPRAHVIHLVRRASGFATSHLRPSWSRDAAWWRRGVRRLRHEYAKQVFWSRDDFPPGMRRDLVIGRHPQSKFGLMLAEAGYDAGRIMAAPSVVRLLAYWHFHYQYIERQGPRLFGGRFTRVRYEEFARDPESVMARLYDWVGLARPEPLAFPDVHSPKPPFRPGDRHWRRAADTAGFTEEEMEQLL